MVKDGLKILLKVTLGTEDNDFEYEKVSIKILKSVISSKLFL